MSYRALPEGLFISESPIAGQGVFTKRPLNVGTNLGMSHLIVDEIIYRTPLGGFINHSDTPNCEKYFEDEKYYVRVIRPVNSMEELFLKYTFYEV